MKRRNKQAAAAQVPEDMKRLASRLARRGKPGAAEVYGGGRGESGLGSAIVAAQQKKKDIDDAQEAQNKKMQVFMNRWTRFSRRWAGHPRWGDAAASMTVWEWSKARVEPRKALPEASAEEHAQADARRADSWAWFSVLPSETRVQIVEDEVKRLNEERRYRLARRKLYLQKAARKGMVKGPPVKKLR